MDVYKLALVGFGGFFGSVARYATSLAMANRFHGVFPYSTLTVNIAGSFLLGIGYGYILHRSGDMHSVKLLLMTGFCGGFTTFSAFAIENLQLLEQRFYSMVALYTISSLLLGVAAVWFGIMLGKNLG